MCLSNSLLAAALAFVTVADISVSRIETLEREEFAYSSCRLKPDLCNGSILLYSLVSLSHPLGSPLMSALKSNTAGLKAPPPSPGYVH